MKRVATDDSHDVKKIKSDLEIDHDNATTYITAKELVRRMTYLGQYFPNACLVFDCVAWFCDENNKLINQQMFCDLRNELEKSDFHYDIMSNTDDYTLYSTLENPMEYYYVLVNSNKSEFGLYDIVDEIFEYLYDGIQLTYEDTITFPFKDKCPTNINFNERKWILNNIFPDHGVIELTSCIETNKNSQSHFDHFEDITFTLRRQELVYLTIEYK